MKLRAPRLCLCVTTITLRVAYFIARLGIVLADARDRVWPLWPAAGLGEAAVVISTAAVFRQYTGKGPFSGQAEVLQ
jgi:hypothetical protein